MSRTFASYVEVLESAGLPGTFQRVRVPVLAFEGRTHLRRDPKSRICDWGTEGTSSVQKVEALLERDDLCERCFPGALESTLHMSSIGDANALVLVSMCLQTLRETRSLVNRVERSQKVSTEKVYVLHHAHNRLLKNLEDALFWVGAHTDAYEELTSRLRESATTLRSAIQSEDRRAVVRSKVQQVQAKVKRMPDWQLEPDQEVLLYYYSDISAEVRNLPMLVSEVLLTYALTHDKGVTALVAPGEVVSYLFRVSANKGWRLQSRRSAVVPEDTWLRETALGVWDPTGNGPLKFFEDAVKAAELPQ